MIKADRIGEKHVTNNWGIIEIIEYLSSTNITVRFLDGTVKKGVRYDHILEGNVGKFINRVGEKYTSNEGYNYTIINYVDHSNCDVMFEDGIIVRNKRYKEVSRSVVKHPYHKVACNTGFIGEGKYKPFNNKGRSLVYKKWAGIIQRGYSEKIKKKRSAYKNCTVVEEWHNFQNFAKWFEENYNPKIMKGWHIDKDILVKGNKIYSPETCCFVPIEVNSLFTYNKKYRKGLPIGVTKTGKRFLSTGKSYLGTYDTPEEAFYAYKEAKEKYIKEVADKWKGKINEKVYEAMYNWKIEITD